MKLWKFPQERERSLHWVSALGNGNFYPHLATTTHARSTATSSQTQTDGLSIRRWNAGQLVIKAKNVVMKLRMLICLGVTYILKAAFSTQSVILVYTYLLPTESWVFKQTDTLSPGPEAVLPHICSHFTAKWK